MPLRGAPRCLMVLGLVVVPADDDTVLVPVKPDLALTSLLRPIDETAQKIRAGFESVRGIYKAAVREQPEYLSVLSGDAVVATELEEAVRGCRSELMTIQPLGERQAYDISDPHLVGSGVSHRTLYPHAARANAPVLRHIRQIREACGEVRTLDQVTDRLIICDQSVAYVAFHQRDGSSGAVRIAHPAVVRFLVCVFESSWERARPVDSASVRDRHPSVTGEVQQAVMRLLVAGHTDDRIARRLGISRRSVAAHVARISEALNSRSRAQLGYLIALNGVVDDTGPAESLPAETRLSA